MLFSGVCVCVCDGGVVVGGGGLEALALKQDFKGILCIYPKLAV